MHPIPFFNRLSFVCTLLSCTPKKCASVCVCECEVTIKSVVASSMISINEGNHMQPTIRDLCFSGQCGTSHVAQQACFFPLIS